MIDLELTAEAVMSNFPRRHTVYWRWTIGPERYRIGAVSRRRADGKTALNDADCAAWKAIGYGRRMLNDNVELGTFPTRREAEAALRDYALREGPLLEAQARLRLLELRVLREEYRERAHLPAEIEDLRQQIERLEAAR